MSDLLRYLYCSSLSRSKAQIWLKMFIITTRTIDVYFMSFQSFSVNIASSKAFPIHPSTTAS